MDYHDIKRFFTHVKFTPTCWFWQACVTGNYGRFNPKRKGSLRAHRLAYMMTHGPIPKGVLVLHSCDEPTCVNPAHLRLGTHQDNMQDAIDRNRICYKLTAKQVRYARKSNESVRSLAERFGVNYYTMRDIKRGVTWKHIR